MSKPIPTPETDAERERYRKILDQKMVVVWGAVVPLEFAQKLERERNELVAWLKEAVPVMESACCIVAEISPARLGEIEGCRALLETCPVKWERMPHLLTAGDARRSSNAPAQQPAE